LKASCTSKASEFIPRRIRVPRVVSVADCGRVISPRTAASQVRGGVVWGIGASLREASEVDPRYGGFLSADLAEYVLPVNADIGPIDVEFINEPDLQFNSAGAKGLGEVSLTGVAPANAVFHATGRRLRDLPIRIWVGPGKARSEHFSSAVSRKQPYPCTAANGSSGPKADVHANCRVRVYCGTIIAKSCRL
jgi:Molybdopterin-binding domain of aldehyde dehydrogenase